MNLPKMMNANVRGDDDIANVAVWAISRFRSLPIEMPIATVTSLRWSAKLGELLYH